MTTLEEAKESFVEMLKRWGLNVVGPVLVLVVVLIGILLLAMGFKELQIGGLIGKLLGKKDKSDPDEVIELANSVDKDRVAEDGRVIQPGEADSKGITQAVVVPIKNPGLFSDPKTVTFTPPGEKKPKKVVLPDGVTNKDVEQVVIVKPKVVAVAVRDRTGISAKRIDELLAKYAE